MPTSRLLVCLCLALTFALAVQSHPLNWYRTSSHAAERAWSLWGWFWAPDSLVTVVDREHPMTFASRPALFGAELRNPVLGYVIPLASFTRPCSNTSDDDPVANDSNVGCPRLCVHGPHIPQPSEPWIALVQRGNCSFADKAREAQRLGAKALVVGGGDPSVLGQPDALISMMDPGDTEDLTLLATFIRWSDYTTLQDLIATSDTIHSGLRTVSLLVATDSQTGGWVSPTLTFISILLLPSLLTFITLLIHRFRMIRAARRERAPEDIVRSLPWRVWTSNGWEKHEGTLPGRDHPCTSPADPPATQDIEEGILGHDETRSSDDPEPSGSGDATRRAGDDDNEPAWAKRQTECAICLSEFAVGDRVRVLPCAHIFHMDEVDGWLINNKKLCPICKADVTQTPGSAPRPSETQPETLIAPATEHTPLLPRAHSPPSDTAS